MTTDQYWAMPYYPPTDFIVKLHGGPEDGRVVNLGDNTPYACLKLALHEVDGEGAKPPEFHHYTLTREVSVIYHYRHDGDACSHVKGEQP